MWNNPNACHECKPYAFEFDKQVAKKKKKPPLNYISPYSGVAKYCPNRPFKNGQESGLQLE